MIAAHNELGVVSLASNGPGKSPETLAAETRERNRIHLAGIEADRVRGEAMRADQAAQDARAAAVRTDNPFFPLPEANDGASRREALKTVLSAVVEAQEGERVVVCRIAAGVREKATAEARHALAAAATASVREAGAADMKAWLEGGCQGDKPDGAGAVSAAVTAEAQALADVQVITAALDALRLDHEAAQIRTEQAQHAAKVAADRIVSAHAIALAAELTAADAQAAELRRSLSAFCRSVPMNTRTPRSVTEAMPVQHVPVELFGPSATAESAHWSEWRAALLLDPHAELSPV